MGRFQTPARGQKYSTQSEVWHVSDAHGLTPKQLAHELHLTAGSITTMSDRLESSGFLVRKPNPADRRSLLLQLTPAGTCAIA
ncbi:MarR family transcriptional regulator [Paenarthrobacter sp. Z7-10]|uniref:MarR family transcriptional regulator n=1 Tax=Paenarthrobacter sp. Z7-10 TaxID=2787635 RepID=UPI0022A924CD|nr:MarR family transcriptional regulator [Paenarthrobacter sp. Z7-10]MCZ2403443.1 MarR family transcriptional regulator [Paenarthrobacter sp. Z7-10]